MTDKIIEKIKNNNPNKSKDQSIRGYFKAMLEYNHRTELQTLGIFPQFKKVRSPAEVWPVCLPS